MKTLFLIEKTIQRLDMMNWPFFQCQGITHFSNMVSKINKLIHYLLETNNFNRKIVLAKDYEFSTLKILSFNKWKALNCNKPINIFISYRVKISQNSVLGRFLLIIYQCDPISIYQIRTEDISETCWKSN